MFSFSYSVTRQYPYRWFMPVAVVGGIVLAVLFSAVNYFFNAFNMVTLATDDPDSLITRFQLENVPEIFRSKIKPRCQDTVIPFGSNIYTNQTALSYQLLSVNDQESPALTYHNQPLGGCSAEKVIIDFQNNAGRQAALVSRSGWDVTVNAEIVCRIGFYDTTQNWRDLYLGARYDPLSPIATPGVSRFILVNASLSFAWAETVLLGFWTETVTAIFHQTAQGLDAPDSTSSLFNLSSGYITFQNPHRDIKNASFFQKGQYAFFNARSEGFVGNFSTESSTSYETLITDAPWPNVWAPAGRLAKAMFSVIGADLSWDGYTETFYNVKGWETWEIWSGRDPVNLSMIATPDQLHYWSENLTQIWDASTVTSKDSLSTGLRMTQYNEVSDGALNFTHSVISTTYTCQVPQIKSGFNVFISIFVADLVLLRVAWTLYNLVVTYFLNSRHPDSNLCLGCLERGRTDDAGTEELQIVDAGDDTAYQGRDIELGDLGRDHEEPADQQSLQKLLTRKPVGS